MANTNNIVALMIALTVGAVFFVPVADVVTDNSGVQTVNNSTVTTSLDYSQNYSLGGYDIQTDSETIQVLNTTSDEYENLSDSDYDIYYESGMLNITDTSATSSGDEIRANYDYQATGSTTTTIVDLLPLLLALLLLIPLANRVQGGL